MRAGRGAIMSVRSSMVTRNPHCSSVRAAAIPAGPDPTTTVFSDCPTYTGNASVSCPARGFSAQPIGESPLPICAMHQLHEVQGLISSNRPVRTLLGHCGSASMARAKATKSAEPSSIARSATSAWRITPTVMTGILTCFLIARAKGMRQPSGSQTGSTFRSSRS